MSRRSSAIADVLRQRFFSGLHLGLLKPGERLPSARDLATEFGVDRRAVLAAYRELEAEGLVELRQRSGIYFSALDTPTGETLTRRSAWVVGFLLRGLSEGVPAPETPDRLHQYLATLQLRAACVECNDDQTAALSAELRTDYGLHTTGVDADALMTARTPPSEVRRADLLVTTPFHAGEVKEVAERLDKPWIAVSLRADIFAEIARLLPAGPVYFVVADPRFAAKLGKIFAASPAAANLRVLVAGADDVAHVPERAPVYVTRLARERLRGAALLGRVMPEARALAAQSARELLTFVVRANMEALAARGR